MIRRLLISLGLLVAPAAQADVRLSAIVSDHMVLQSGQPAPVWGRADPGERITVRFQRQTLRAAAGSDGKWRVTLKPLEASATPAQMTVQGRNGLTVSDILVGEVWLASGQFNMQKPFRNKAGQKDVFNAEAELAAATTPQIRLFKVAQTSSNAPVEDVRGHWVVTTPQSLDASRFSAIGYIFGKRLHSTLNVPVGMIDSTYGGTRIERWTAPEGWAAVSALFRFTNLAPGQKVDQGAVSDLYYAMIQPMAPFGLKGVIWYQGESNAIDPGGEADYAAKMEALVAGWRTKFEGSLPFYYVQIAPHLYHIARPGTPVSPEVAPRIQEAQADALRIPGTGMVVVNDLVDDLLDIHPREKHKVADRLADMALTRTYGATGLVTDYPRFRDMRVADGKAVLRFDGTAGGLIARDDKPLTWFAIRGADGIWYPGTATIAGDAVTVSNPAVPAPVAVRYAWDEAAQPNLASKAGLPAIPFRTDRN